MPWAVVLRSPAGLLGTLALSRRTFKPSEQKPTIVIVRAGRVVRSAHGNEVIPVLRMDVELLTDKGRRIGLLARLRDVLPGRYAFGLTGRGPGGRVLPRGRYILRMDLRNEVPGRVQLKNPLRSAYRARLSICAFAAHGEDALFTAANS